MRGAGKLCLGLALSLAMSQAGAVDVDRIEIHSRLGEPLLAEIPLTGASAADLAQVEAQLASPTTFARIGLPRPQGLVAGLRFEVVRGPRPLIRVTSAEPVHEEFLTFLMQVDAPQGRLVREYSLALGAAPSLQAPLSPALQAPTAAPGDAIARPADPADARPVPALPALPAPHGDAGSAAATPGAAPIPVIGRAPRRPQADPIALHGDPAPAHNTPAARAVATPLPRAVQQPPRPPARSGREPAARVQGERQVEVGRGDTLTGVVQDMRIEGASLHQAMLAVLRTNPQAFAEGNIHRLQHGAVLRAPSPDELVRFDAASAEAVVRLQTEQWRVGAAAQAVPAMLAPLVQPAPPAAIRVPPARGARLEIASAQPDGAGPGAAGAPGGFADPVDRERAAADLVAARYTEFQQMQQRIADLEQAQRAQARLLLLKDRQLAAQRPQAAGMWPWLAASLALGAVLAAALRPRGPRRPGHIAKALGARVQGTATRNAAAPR